jgi:hypothetical protein
MERSPEDQKFSPYERLAGIIFGGSSISPDHISIIENALNRLETIDKNKVGVEIIRRRWFGEPKSQKEVAKEMELQPLAVRKHETRIISALKHEISSSPKGK